MEYGGEIFLHRLQSTKANITGLPVIIALGSLSSSDATTAWLSITDLDFGYGLVAKAC